ncbi:MAG: HNH endonuclease, partial [Gemmataceae bacterium]
MVAYLLTWNPDVWGGEVTTTMEWSCGHTKRIVPGDRLFLMRQVREPRGVCASGWSVSHVIEDESGESTTRRYVRMQVETFRDPATAPILTRDALDDLNRGVEQPMKWGIQSSGTRIPSLVARRLEEAWERLCGGPPPCPDEMPVSGPLVEGAGRVIVVNAYERDPEARRRCIAAHGTSCCVCGLSFGVFYGPAAEGFIHVHHV